MAVCQNSCEPIQQSLRSWDERCPAGLYGGCADVWACL